MLQSSRGVRGSQPAHATTSQDKASRMRSTVRAPTASVSLHRTTELPAASLPDKASHRADRSRQCVGFSTPPPRAFTAVAMHARLGPIATLWVAVVVVVANGDDDDERAGGDGYGERPVQKGSVEHRRQHDGARRRDGLHDRVGEPGSTSVRERGTSEAGEGRTSGERERARTLTITLTAAKFAEAYADNAHRTADAGGDGQAGVEKRRTQRCFKSARKTTFAS
eukprot:3454798-Pleurochrysis_carterae.AAC.5